MEAILADRARWQASAADMRAYAERTFRPETMVASHLALYREMIRGGRARARSRASWTDLAVRLAIEVYWRRRPGPGRRPATGGPARATADEH